MSMAMNNHMNTELLKKNFGEHGFETSFFETKEQATEYLTGKIKGKKVAFGGSMTVQEMKLDKALAEENEVIWRTRERESLMEARAAEVYITSANGVSETGELINIDGRGNRVSQTLFGPEKVYYVVGYNKLAPTMHQAMTRAKNIAAPKNAVRLNAKTPCAAHGGDRCYDCSSPDRLCRATVILERPCRDMEAEVVFINEELGY